ncbi:MAG: response regulator [Candidatus Lokiarchaeota archaeon]
MSKRGDLGLELIKAGNPDLIILDIQLPEKSGIEIVKEIRSIEKFKKIPIIAVTSFAMKGDKDRILAAGFDEYISKPIRVQEFRELVKSLLK